MQDKISGGWREPSEREIPNHIVVALVNFDFLPFGPSSLGEEVTLPAERPEYPVRDCIPILDAFL